jgi:hypothetical protein
MNTALQTTEELIGEHQAICAYMQSLSRSAEKLAGDPDGANQRIWSYRQKLYDFRDVIWYHHEFDERIFKALLGADFTEDSPAEHSEIQRLINEMISLADDTIVDRMDWSEVDHYCGDLELALTKIRKMIELHISRENAIIDRVQRSTKHLYA